MLNKVLVSSGMVVLTAIALIGAIVLAALNRQVPEALWTVIYILVGAGAGVAGPPAAVGAPTTAAPPAPKPPA